MLRRRTVWIWLSFFLQHWLRAYRQPSQELPRDWSMVRTSYILQMWEACFPNSSSLLDCTRTNFPGIVLLSSVVLTFWKLRISANFGCNGKLLLKFSCLYGTLLQMLVSWMRQKFFMGNIRRVTFQLENSCHSCFINHWAYFQLPWFCILKQMTQAKRNVVIATYPIIWTNILVFLP